MRLPASAPPDAVTAGKAGETPGRASQTDVAAADLERAAEPPAALVEKQSDALKRPPGSAAASPSAARQQADAGSSLAFATAPPAGIEIVSPDTSTRWRLTGPAVEHSTDGGSTWNTVFTLAGAELTGGAAPSASICWVIGRRGVVLRSTDGRTFSPVTSPAMTDLSAVNAADARSASVFTIDGRTFSTTDGGTTWRRR